MVDVEVYEEQKPIKKSTLMDREKEEALAMEVKANLIYVNEQKIGPSIAILGNESIAKLILISNTFADADRYLFRLLIYCVENFN